MTVFFISGCATKIDVHARNEPFLPVKTYGLRTIPAPDFPSVVIIDSVNQFKGKPIQLFYVKKIDGKSVANARTETQFVSYGSGFTFGWRVLRHLPIRKSVLILRAENYGSAKLFGLFRKDAGTTKTVAFTPETGRSYVVMGKIDESSGGSDVYIADEQTRQRVKVEIVE